MGKNLLKFYTGLPNWTALEALFELVLPALPKKTKMSQFHLISLLQDARHLCQNKASYKVVSERTTHNCSEEFLEKPSNLLARAQVWSNYKHHSTIKFLIGITAQGGQISDKEIVKRSDLVHYIQPDDVILADRAFTCSDYASMALAEVKMPPFTK
uniref:DDE Tnp4 domain-containing protein n=1 Tax=Amphimedon queenslandica TaxID=400682 RepID=A0A1X7V3A4_AMPQE